MSPPTSPSEYGIAFARQPRPVRVRLPPPEPGGTSDQPRRWRVVVVTEVTEASSDSVPQFLSVEVGTTGWAPLPHALLDRPIGEPDARPIGTVERIWREPAPPSHRDHQDLVLVWAEGVLDPGEPMPAPYADEVLWVDQIEATGSALRVNLDRIAREAGAAWLDRLADEIGCDTRQVGVGPVSRLPAGARPDPVLRQVIGDLRFEDRRVRYTQAGLDSLGRIEAAAIPLDNPFVVDRVARWEQQIQMVPSLASQSREDDPRAEILRRLDALQSQEPPDLAL